MADTIMLNTQGETATAAPSVLSMNRCVYDASFAMFDGSLADLTYLDFFLARFLIIEYFYVLPFTNRAFTPAVRGQLPYSLSPVGF
jgi:hypothetical protein